jgi:hypothetical protein
MVAPESQDDVPSFSLISTKTAATREIAATSIFGAEVLGSGSLTKGGRRRQPITLNSLGERPSTGNEIVRDSTYCQANW